MIVKTVGTIFISFKQFFTLKIHSTTLLKEWKDKTREESKKMKYNTVSLMKHSILTTHKKYAM